MKSRLMMPLVVDLVHYHGALHRTDHIFAYLIFTNYKVEVPDIYKL